MHCVAGNCVANPEAGVGVDPKGTAVGGDNCATGGMGLVAIGVTNNASCASILSATGSGVVEGVIVGV